MRWKGLWGKPFFSARNVDLSMFLALFWQQSQYSWRYQLGKQVVVDDNRELLNWGNQIN